MHEDLIDLLLVEIGKQLPRDWRPVLLAMVNLINKRDASGCRVEDSAKSPDFQRLGCPGPSCGFSGYVPITGELPRFLGQYSDADPSGKERIQNLPKTLTMAWIRTILEQGSPLTIQQILGKLNISISRASVGEGRRLLIGMGCSEVGGRWSLPATPKQDKTKRTNRPHVEDAPPIVVTTPEVSDRAPVLVGASFHAEFLNAVRMVPISGDLDAANRILTAIRGGVGREHYAESAEFYARCGEEHRSTFDRLFFEMQLTPVRAKTLRKPARGQTPMWLRPAEEMQ